MKWKMVPVEATLDQRNAAKAMKPAKVSEYSAMVAAAPPYVVTDEDVEAAHAAYTKAYWSRDNTLSVHDCMRAALESFVRRLGGGE